MRVVCICEDEAAVNCVKSGLLPDHEVPLVIVPDFTVPRKRSHKFNGQIVGKVINKVFFSVFNRCPDKKKIETLIDQNVTYQKCIGEEVVTIPSHEVNSVKVIEMIKKHDPDMLFVCGAPILKPAVFDLPRYGSINFHFGYSPVYKGQHCLLWAYLNRDYRNLAGTFLKIDKGIDTGGPLAFVFPEIQGADSYETIESRIAEMGKQVIAEVFEKSKSSNLIDTEMCRDVTIKYSDYGFGKHIKYLITLAFNRLVKRGDVLRAEEVKFQFSDKS